MKHAYAFCCCSHPGSQDLELHAFVMPCWLDDSTTTVWCVQATDSIVEFAVMHDKPFAVVPCCVFPRLFKHRRLKEGVPVTVHAELVEYLRHAGGQDCRVEHLKFEGMNQVVFSVQAM